MPEGPEIRLAADSVAAALVGKKVVEVTFGLPQLTRYERRLRGNVVTAVDTRGKAMLTRFDHGLTIYSHNQLYGRWFVTERHTYPDTARQLRLALHTDACSALLYSASDIEVLTAAQLARHPFLNRLGPDILDPALDAAAVVRRLEKRRFRNRSLGSLYLDQAMLAGLGNYLRSEILWAARVNPSSAPHSLPCAEKRRLARQTLVIARRSYRTRGVTVPDRTARERKARGLRYAQYRFQVFGREGLPCYRCGTSIERHTSGSRNIFVCPSCQAA